MFDPCTECESAAAYVEDRLDAAQRERFLDHAADCDECRRATAFLVVSRPDSVVLRRVPDDLRARALAAVPGAGECPDAQTVASYIDGQLDAEERTLFLGHIADCEDCRREVALQQSAPPAGGPVPAHVKARVVSAVPRGSRRMRPIRRVRWSLTAWAVSAAAVAIAAVALVIVLRRDDKPQANEPSIAEKPVEEGGRPAPMPDRPPTRAPIPEESYGADSKEHPQPADEEPEAPPAAKPPPDEPRPADPEPPLPRREPVRSRLRETVSLAPVKLTDISGELSLRRRGKDKPERVARPVEIREGDRLIAERQVAFFVLGGHPITLLPQTEIGIGFEEASAGPALLLERGEALVDSSETDTNWYVGTRHVSVRIEGTRAHFAASFDGRSLGLTALAGRLNGRDDYGRPFDLRAGEKLLASAESAGTSREEDAQRKAAILVSSRPSGRTLFHWDFRPGSFGGVTFTEGGVQRGTEFLSAVDVKGTLGATIKLPKDVMWDWYVVRLRVRTNLQLAHVVVVVEDIARIEYAIRPGPERRGAWFPVEFSIIHDPDAKPVSLREHASPIVTTDRLLSIGVTGRRKDVFADERPYLHVDDVSLIYKPPPAK